MTALTRGEAVKTGVAVDTLLADELPGSVPMQITTIGLDIAKNVFQVHGIDTAEKVVVRKQLRRSQVLAFFKTLPPCLVGMEACATSHYWARELTKLGHLVRLMPAKDVKAYVKRNKNDAADAEAICEAVRRPTMRFVQVKSVKQQGHLMLHLTRDLLMRQRTQLINALRAHMAELGIVARKGARGQGAAEDHCGRTNLPSHHSPPITPPPHPPTGGKQKLGPISKQGDQYLRRILVVGAHAVLSGRARNQEISVAHAAARP